MAVANSQSVDEQADVSMVLFEHLQRLEKYLVGLVEKNGHWDDRIRQVELIEKSLFRDSELLHVAYDPVMKIISSLKNLPVAPPGIREQLDHINHTARSELNSFEAVLEWYTPTEFAILLKAWLRKTQSELYKHHARVPRIVQRISREIFREVLKLQRRTKCVIVDESEETD